jgi:hypothetical protein
MKIAKPFSKMMCLLLFVFAVSFAQTTIKVTYYTGSTQNYTIENSGKLYFSGQFVGKNREFRFRYFYPDRYYPENNFFTQLFYHQEIGLNKDQIRLYPNPSAEFIRITSDKKESLKVKIYSAEGRLVLSGTYQPNEDINISSFREGFYLVQVNNTTLKLIKK